MAAMSHPEGCSLAALRPDSLRAPASRRSSVPQNLVSSHEMGRCCLPPTFLHLSMLSADSGRLALSRGFPRGASRAWLRPKTSPALLRASTPALISRSSRGRAAPGVLTPDTRSTSASARHLPSVQSCSDCVVSHHRAGLLRARSAGLLHPAAGHGLRCVWRTRSVTLTRHRPCGRCRAARTPSRGM